MKCQYCGTEGQGKFCSNCGAPLPAQPQGGISLPNINQPQQPMQGQMPPQQQLRQPPPPQFQQPQQQYQQPIPPRHDDIVVGRVPHQGLRGWQIALIVIGAVVAFLFVLAGIGSLASNGKPASTPISDSSTNQLVPQTPSKEQKKDDVKNVLGINEAFDNKGLKVTLVEISKSAGSDFDKPKDGMEYVIVRVSYENTSDEPRSYNPFDFKMSNSQGQITSQTFSIAANDTALGSGELSTGGKVSGTLVFEQPKDDAKLTLLYYGNILSKDVSAEFKANY